MLTVAHELIGVELVWHDCSGIIVETEAYAAEDDAATGGPDTVRSIYPVVVIVTSDGDLQNDPRDIPAMVERLEREGCDIVCGWRRHRKDAFLTRHVPSVIANWLLGLVSGVPLHDNGCSLKVFRAEVVKPLRLYGEMHRFLPAIASQIGVKIAEVVVILNGVRAARRPSALRQLAAMPARQPEHAHA